MILGGMPAVLDEYLLSGGGSPLEAGVKEGHFKAVFLDVGLMQNMCGSGSEVMFADDLKSQRRRRGRAVCRTGATVLSPSISAGLPVLLGPGSPQQQCRGRLPIACGSQVIPVEVKAGKTGTLRSMHLFLQHYRAPGGVKISTSSHDGTVPVVRTAGSEIPIRQPPSDSPLPADGQNPIIDVPHTGD